MSEKGLELDIEPRRVNVGEVPIAEICHLPRQRSAAANKQSVITPALHKPHHLVKVSTYFATASR
jgi:hypothetical protein